VHAHFTACMDEQCASELAAAADSNSTAAPVYAGFRVSIEVCSGDASNFQLLMCDETCQVL
jgi:hypothetical protein